MIQRCKIPLRQKYGVRQLESIDIVQNHFDLEAVSGKNLLLLKVH